MSQSWKCCPGCQCPCKNNDLCPDTAAHLMARGGQNEPSYEDLLNLEQKIDKRIKNISNIPVTNQTTTTGTGTNTTPSSDFQHSSGQGVQANEMQILRQRLHEAEMTNAMIEEKVKRLESSRRGVDMEDIQQMKEQIIGFVEKKFNQFMKK